MSLIVLFFSDDLGKDILKNAEDGYNGCLFAYGQTGAGKSHSVLGTADDPGILPRVCQGLFNIIEDGYKKKSNSEYLVEVSFLEIYNERIRDLASRDPKDQLDIRQSPQHGVFIPGLDRIPVSSTRDIEAVLACGMRTRTVAATNMNAASSRSHAVFTIHFKQKFFSPESKKVVQRSSQIHLVDLAGSERASKTQASGVRLKEGAMINQSLSTLGIVISKLAQNATAKAEGKQLQFIPFRNSKLTHLLSDALAGNTKTVMVAAISPAASNFEESLSTLRFAKTCKSVTTCAHRNEETDENMVGALKEEIARLRLLLDQTNVTTTTQNTVVANSNNSLKDSTDDANQVAAAEAEARRLASELHDMQSLMSYYKTSWDDFQKRSEEESKARETQLLPMSQNNTSLFSTSLTDHQTQSSSVGTGTSQLTGLFLVNLSDDPQLEGRLSFKVGHIPIVTMGSSQDSTYQVEGLGISPYMLDIAKIDTSVDADLLLRHSSSNTYNSIIHDHSDPNIKWEPGLPKIKIRAAYSDCRVLINGIRASSERWTVLNHSDRLYVGRAQVFKLVDYDEVSRLKLVPPELKSRVLKSYNKSSLNGSGVLSLALAEIVPDGTEEYQQAAQFISELEGKIGHLRSKQFLKQFKQALILVEEANDITRTMKHQSRIRFSVEVLTNVLHHDVDAPEIAIRVWRDQRPIDRWRAVVRRILSPRIANLLSRIVDPSLRITHGTAVPLYVWDFPKFSERLEIMRDDFQSWFAVQKTKHNKMEPFSINENDSAFNPKLSSVNKNPSATTTTTNQDLNVRSTSNNVTNNSMTSVFNPNSINLTTPTPTNSAAEFGLISLTDPWNDLSMEYLRTVIDSASSLADDRVRHNTSLLSARLRARDEEIKHLKLQIAALKSNLQPFDSQNPVFRDSNNNHNSSNNSAYQQLQGSSPSKFNSGFSMADAKLLVENNNISPIKAENVTDVTAKAKFFAEMEAMKRNNEILLTGNVKDEEQNNSTRSDSPNRKALVEIKSDVKSRASKLESMFDDLGSLYAKWDQMNSKPK